MAILIDIETPQNCKECPFSDIVVVGHIYREQYICNFSGKHQSLRMQKRPDWCPLREINTDGDLISRQAAVEKILRNKDAKPLNESDYQDGFRAGLDIAYCEIRDLPSAEPAHKAERTGEWINKDGELVCSVCGNSVSFSRTPKGWVLGRFCQTCGAKMDGGK